MKHTFRFLLFSLLFIVSQSYGQQVQQSAWLASFNSVKLSEKWGLHFDIQLRSADDVEYFRHLLVRPGLTYFINGKQNVTAGYAWIETFADPDLPLGANFTEHRLWQQYIYAYKIKSIPVSHRFRLEQRFIERTGEDVFSQRLRYFARAIVPFKTDEAGFTKGAFAALQNEIFLNIQNKDKINNSTFDQNRAYVALGYRLSKRVDLEAGYLNHYQKGAVGNTTNHVGQLAVYARF
ncbi:DUF2490 domain-containing protein [Pedobacter sp. SYSU D00535]|uniref:DUF2490 domain-containing protein n=1 Tax=Pedobacter sp. SYSU D00535 TaxID=2810308 RepID=UPI001A9620BB|nr:DUF2490 domain-containing protein [Pedobacter sp. SYSU D00535]